MLLESVQRRELDAKKNGKLFSGFTEEDAANVVLYTFNFGPSNFENNLYNKALTDNDVESLNMVRGLLFLVMQSIRKLPRASGRTTVQRHERHCGQVYAYVKGKTIVCTTFLQHLPA